MNLSPSKVDTFLNCQQLFKYRYIDKLPEPENKYFLLGSLAHRTLELFHKNLDEGDYSELMGKCFKRAAVENKTKLKIASGLIKREDLEDTKEMLKLYLDRFNERRIIPNTISIEKLIKISMKGYDIWAKADRIDQKDNEIYIIDYKTNKSIPSDEELLSSVQLPTYALYSSKNYSLEEYSVYGVYIYLKHIGSSKGAIRKFEVSEELINEAVEKYTRVNNHLKSGLEFEKNTDFKYCGRFCSFYERCQLKG